MARHPHTNSYFAVQNRDCIIQGDWKDELHKYITGIVQNNKYKLLTINGIADHVHILFGFRPSQLLSDLMQDIKGSPSRRVNVKHLLKGKFSWQACLPKGSSARRQEGYGAFRTVNLTCPM
jgi:REP element-mobilizing transposase RayT